MKRTQAGQSRGRAGPRVAPDTLESSSVEAILRELIGRFTPVDEASPAYQLGGLLVHCLEEAEVDGSTYLLVRVLEPTPAAKHVLSPRESEIARMIAKGYPNKTIAAVLEISGWTVCTYLRRMFAKLGVSSRAAMIARLIENGQLCEAVEESAGGARAGRSPYSGQPVCDQDARTASCRTAGVLLHRKAPIG